MPAKTDYAKLASEYGTPFYFLSKTEAKNRVREIKKRFPKNAKLCYAIKANAFLTAFLKDEDILFEVCSPGELSICEKIGMNPNKIVFSGVVKTLEDVKRAYALKVNTITLESKAHCEYLLEAAKSESQHKQQVILRLSGGNQFGMSEKDLAECISKIKKAPSIKIRGIHFFTGTQKKFKTISEEIPYIEDYCTHLKSDFGLENLEIEYGAGLPYDYFSNQDEKHNFSALEEFSKLIENSTFSYVIELGRYIASPCAKYVTKIIDVKGDEKNKYCLIDGGINHINYFGQMMGMKVPKIEHISQINAFSDAENYTIAGSLCTTADIVIRKIPLSAPTIEDLLVFNDIGAYSITEGIYLFLSHPLPAVLCDDNGEVSVLRKITETYTLNI
ncbi:diaminopimelate decarboxylase family protein [Treponema zioleckii]|uniref:diaminopimelate decarboxylase family protein n=1 Tax=Treponema zioleckii TaxID=331680 RepID=UPI00168AE1C7|nr:alanine racemase [Treponema zioleckii]